MGGVLEVGFEGLKDGRLKKESKENDRENG